MALYFCIYWFFQNAVLHSLDLHLLDFWCIFVLFYFEKKSITRKVSVNLPMECEYFPLLAM
jgi:hypothetical protein